MYEAEYSMTFMGSFSPRNSQNCVIDEYIELGSLPLMKELYPPGGPFFLASALGNINSVVSIVVSVIA